MKFRDRISAAYRAFKGAGGELYDRITGHDSDTYGPAEYGNYLLTSNAVYTCATLRADAISSVPIHAYELDENGKQARINEGEAVRLLKKVNPYWTMNRLVNMTELCLSIWGRAFWFVERDGANNKGKPKEIWWAKPTQVKIFPDPANYIKGFAYYPISGGEPIWFDPWEVVWFRYPNPLDEFSGLAPLAAARLAADLAEGASKSNLNLYKQGYQIGGWVVPPKGTTLTKEQATELEAKIDKRFKGVDKAHRWGVFRFEADMRAAAVTPKDAEYLGSLEWSLEETARAYKIPLDMVGGQRTYENVKASDRAFWMRAMLPEASFLESELNEQYLPMFGSGAPDLVAFDRKAIPALQDDETETWEREQGQIQVGAITINEWRDGQGLEPVEWGSEWWAPMTVAPVGTASITSGEGDGRQVYLLPSNGNTPGIADRFVLGAGSNGSKRAVEYGSQEHERIYKRFERRSRRWEREVGEVVAKLFERLQDSILDRMRSRESIPEDWDPYNRPEWIKKFRIGIRPILSEIVEDAGETEMDQLDEIVNERGARQDESGTITLDFKMDLPEVRRFLERQAQRFAVEVEETTWEALKASLQSGFDEGDQMIKLMSRVEDVMAHRIRSSSETIARSETLTALNGGAFEAYKQSGVVEKKAWLAGLDDRTRANHIEAHRTYQTSPIPLDEDFKVGAGSGPHPGEIGVAEEDINCRCSIQPIVNLEFRSVTLQNQAAGILHKLQRINGG